MTPENTVQPVQARVEALTIPTYPAGDPDPNPMFYESRNIQGSKGNIYPHPFTDRLSSEKVDHTYQAVILENEFIQMIMLPEIGGRIFAGLDKTNGYDFFYRHKVIKPALIGLFGPWISGGVEFNWPQHHRPSTFDPTDFVLEEHPDGSKTVWMSEHDPLNRTKGMVGICLHPGKAVVETKVRLYNRTALPQTFLWWANAGVKINDQYQVVFPPDVHHAVFHVKNPVTAYPIAKGYFFGNDYGKGTDISWWVNSPEATSFFAGESRYEFFGGYDHEAGAGVVHVADAGISPGKKYFTWANGPFGHAWQKNLMDDTGEYLELMAGVYTDNQPDFSWIMPHETRTFSQFWFPVQKIGAMKNANTRAAVNLEVREGQVTAGVYATEVLPGARILLTLDGQTLMSEKVDLKPGSPYIKSISLPAGAAETALLLRVLDSGGSEVIRYAPEAPWDGTLPEPYQAPEAPEALKSIEELYLTGLHLEQYRHPTLSPEPYWQEALRRDPGDSRSNVAMGKMYFKRGLYPLAEEHFRAAVNRLVSRNLNPYDGEAHYNLGLCLQAQERLEEAYKAFYKSVWNYAWQSAGYYALAQIDLRRGDLTKALEHLDRSLAVNGQSNKARNLKAAALRLFGQAEQAEALARDTLALDPLDPWARYEWALAARAAGQTAEAQARLAEMQRLMRDDDQTYLDVAFDCAAAGLYGDAYALLDLAAGFTMLYPMTAYSLGWLAGKMGDSALRSDWYAQGGQAAPHYCFPWRLEELTVLEDALKCNPDDARAAYYLGNLLYDKRRYEEAVTLWQQASRLEPGYSVPWRNLGLAAYNREKDLDRALECYHNAMAADPADPRLLLEYDYLLRRKAVPPEEILALFEAKSPVVALRDDLTIRLMELYNRLGQPGKTLEIVAGRFFHAWEGGEGLVSGAYANAHWLSGLRALDAGDAPTALQHFRKGTEFPENLGEHPWIGSTVHLMYAAGLAHEALGQVEEARAALERVLAVPGEQSLVGVYHGLALTRLGRVDEARAGLLELRRWADEKVESSPVSNYFYSGHPSPTFEEDPRKQHRMAHILLSGMASLALGDYYGAKSALGQVLAYDPSNLLAYIEYSRL